MRLLHLASTLGPFGSSRYLTHHAIGLKNKGIEQLVLTIGDEAPFAELLCAAGVPVERIRMRNRWDLGGGRAVLRRIREYAPEVMHVWGNAAAWLVDVGMKWEKRVPPYLYSDAEPVLNRGWFWSPFVVQGNREVRSPRVVNVWDDGADPTPQLPGLPPSARLVVNVGRFDNVTDQREAVWIFDIIKHISPDYHLVIVGEGPQRRDVERFAETLSLGVKRVHFLGLRSDVPAILARSEVVLLTHHHGGGTVAREAMAAGKPIVAWTSETFSRLFAESPAGILVSPHDRVGAASALHRILGNAELAKELGAAGRNEALKHTLTPAQLDGWIELYEQIRRQTQ